MAFVDLKTPVWDDDKRLYRPGRNVEVPDALAAKLNAVVADPDENGGNGSGMNYPHAELLAAGGITSADAAKAASYDELLAVEGIGPAKAREIQHFFAGK